MRRRGHEVGDGTHRLAIRRGMVRCPGVCTRRIGVSLPLLAELKRRRVFRALIGYGLAAFAVLQISEPVMHGLHWPESVLSYVVVALARSEERRVGKEGRGGGSWRRRSAMQHGVRHGGRSAVLAGVGGGDGC